MEAIVTPVAVKSKLRAEQVNMAFTRDLRWATASLFVCWGHRDAASQRC
jgi:hypothetical protein